MVECDGDGCGDGGVGEDCGGGVAVVESDFGVFESGDDDDWKVD